MDVGGGGAVTGKAISVRAGQPAAWMVGAGQPGDDPSWGLYLQKSTATTNLSAAGASIVPLPPGLTGEDLLKLAFSIPGVLGQSQGTAYCSAGAPRFNVVSDAGTCFLGCAHGDPLQDATTGGWVKVRFEPPFDSFAGCEAGISGPVTKIRIVMDEGNDVGPGNVVVDNILIKLTDQTTFVITGP